MIEPSSGNIKSPLSRASAGAEDEHYATKHTPKTRIDLQKLAQWADDASRREITEQLLHQAVEIERLDEVAAALAVENAALVVRVKQLEAQLRKPTLTLTRPQEDCEAETEADSEGVHLTPRSSPFLPDHHDDSKHGIHSLASFRKAREFCSRSIEDRLGSLTAVEAAGTVNVRMSASDPFGPEDDSATAALTAESESSLVPPPPASPAYSAAHQKAASVIQARYRRYKLEKRWKEVKIGARRRSLQPAEDGGTPRLSTGSNLSGALYDSGMLGLRIAEEVGLEPDSSMEVCEFPRAFSAPASAAATPETPRSPRVQATSAIPSPDLHHLRRAASARPSPAPLPAMRAHVLPSPLMGSRPDSFLSPATRIEQTAQAISAALQYEDSEADDSITTRSRSPSPDASRWHGQAAAEGASLSSETARLRRIGIYHFNRDPRRGVDWLMGHAILRDEAKDVAHFFHTEPGLNRRMIGEYLGNVTNSFNMAVLDAYVDQFELSSMPFDHALRFFIASFRLPGEAQKIERILQTFARKYHGCNPGLFGNEDTPFVLAFSIVMLNTDVHNAANKRKMTKEDWVRNNRGIDNGQDVPRKYLEEIFDRISAEEFKTLPDNASIVERVAQDIVGCKEQLVATHRQFVRMCIAYEVDEADKANAKGKHARALYLFNDRLVVTKPKGNNKFAYRQSLPLLDLTLTVERSSTRAYPVLSLLNKSMACVYRFSIDPTGRGAGRFEDELREMISTCGEIEQERIKKSKDSDSSSRRSVASTSETSSTAMEEHRESPLRKNTNASKYWPRKKQADTASSS